MLLQLGHFSPMPIGSLGKSDISIARRSQTGHSTSTVYSGGVSMGGGLYRFNVFSDFFRTSDIGVFLLLFS